MGNLYPARGSDRDCRICKACRSIFLTVNHHGPLPLSELHSTDEPIVWILSLFTTCVQSQIHPARDCDTDIMCLLSFFLSFFFFSFSFHFFIFFLSFFFLFFSSSAGHFSYGESPRTPPLEGTSLHRQNNSVERPWGILSLFMTCLQLRVNWFTQPEAVTQI